MEEMDLREYWEIIVKKKSLVAIVFIVTVLAVTIYSFVATPIYEAFTTVMVRESGSSMQSMFFEGLAAGAGGGGNTAQNYIQIMKSRTVLERVVEQVGSEEITAKSLEKLITIQPVQGSDVLKISMESPDPELAQITVNTLTSVFMDWNRRYQQEDRRTARVFIEAQLAAAQENLTRAEERLKEYKEQERVFSLAEETVAKIEQMGLMDALLTEIRITKEEMAERMIKVRENLAKEDETLISSTSIENTFVTEYKRRLADIEIRLSSAREKYTDRHPTIVSLLAEKEDITNKLAEEVERVIGTETMSLNPVHRQLYATLIDLEVETMGLGAREAALVQLIEAQERELDFLPARELELARLIRDAKVTEELYILLRTRYEEARISEAMQTADVHVIDDAILPESPVKPRKMLNIAIGVVLGTFLGVGIAFLAEFVDNTLKTKDDVERLLGIPVLGQIPDFDLVDSNGGQKKLFQRNKGGGFSA